MSIGVEGHALVAPTGRRCTEVRRLCITTPTVTLLVTASVTGNEEAGVERSIADQQLVGVSAAHSSHTVPQFISISTLPIVISGRHRQVRFSFEVGLLFSVVVNEDDFSKLKQRKEENKKGTEQFSV